MRVADLLPAEREEEKRSMLGRGWACLSVRFEALSTLGCSSDGF